MAGPLLLSIKKEKNSKDVLLPKVQQWIVDNSDKLDKYTEEDFEFLKVLTVRGTMRNPNVFSPSGALGCKRAQVIDKFPELRSNRINRIDPKLSLIFDDGKWRHLKWQMLFFKMGLVDSAEEFNTKGDLEYGGSYDLILNLPWIKNPEFRRVIIDIKGAHASDFNQVKATGKPKPAHKMQVMIYCYLTGAKWAIVWYENKNTQEIVEVRVRANERDIRRALRRQNLMRKFVEHKAFPAEECNVEGDDYRYRQCPHRYNCIRLPVWNLLDGQLVKTHEPRKDELESEYSMYNTEPVTKTNKSRSIIVEEE